jgi:hypothetical protein
MSRLLFSGMAGRFDNLLIDHSQAPGQRSRAQRHGDGVGVFEREVARYLPRATRDRLPDDGHRLHLIIDDDGEGPPDIVRGEMGKAPCTTR